MRVLAITKLFPNRAEPLASSFNRQQFAALGMRCDLRVVAPIEWFPGASIVARNTRAGRLSQVPRRDQVAGITVDHPRILHVPRVGTSIAGTLCAGSLARTLWRARREVDVVLASWAYPHGVACIRLARAAGLPVVVKLHGSDINVVAKLAGPKRHLQRHLPKATRVVAVSRALGDEAVALGVSRSNIRVVANGVDSTVFYPRSRAEARRRLGRSEDERIILYVGWLEPTKGVLDLLDSFRPVAARDSQARLVVVGDGSARGECEQRATAIPGVTLVGAKKQAEVADWMAACDILTLPSWNEGTPNVVLEALASGRRVVATRVGGIPDLLTNRECGVMVEARDTEALARALGEAVTEPYDPEHVVSMADSINWHESASRLHAVLAECVGTSSVNDWLAEEPGKAQFLRECARIKRRALAHPIRLVLAAAILTGALVHRVSSKPSIYSASNVYRVSETTVGHSDGLPRDSLQNYIATVVFTKQRIQEAREKFGLFQGLYSIDPEMAQDAMWNIFDITVSRNYFSQYRESEMRTAIVELSVIGADPKLATEIVEHMGNILVSSERERRTQRIAETLAVVAKAAADAAAAFDSETRQAALLELELFGGKSKNPLFSEYQVKMAKRRLAGAQDRLQLAQRAKNTIAYEKRVENESLALLYELVDSVRPLPSERGTVGLVVLATILFLALLPLLAIFFAALDNRVYDVGDIRRLGLSVLAHVPEFPGHRVGAIATRRRTGDRVK